MIPSRWRYQRNLPRLRWVYLKHTTCALKLKIWARKHSINWSQRKQKLLILTFLGYKMHLLYIKVLLCTLIVNTNIRELCSPQSAPIAIFLFVCFCFYLFLFFVWKSLWPSKCCENSSICSTACKGNIKTT
jgi:hypothetical protein